MAILQVLAVGFVLAIFAYGIWQVVESHILDGDRMLTAESNS
jgi:hypothetical protein